MSANSMSCERLGHISHKGNFLTGIKKVKTGDVPALLVTNLIVDVNKAHQNTLIPKPVLFIPDNKNG